MQNYFVILKYSVHEIFSWCAYFDMQRWNTEHLDTVDFWTENIYLQFIIHIKNL